MPVTTQPCRGRKIKSVTDYIDKRCREFYIPPENISIDESTVGFKGRVKWKCYNPKIPTKWGCAYTVYVIEQATFLVLSHIMGQKPQIV